MADVAAPQSDAGAQAAADAEGLVKVKVRGLQQVFARPGATLAGYSKVMLDPIEVAFAKSWDVRPAGKAITVQDKERIQQRLQSLLRDVFTKEISSTHRYTVVDSPGEGVLRVKAEIRDLFINAPDVETPGITRTYARSAGEMTLVAELRDGPTGALIARVIDRARDPESIWLELTSRVENVAAAERAAREWARILREQLDAANRAGAGVDGTRP
jgi:hypothetical protein